MVIMIRVSCAVGLLNVQIYSGLDPVDLIKGEIIDPASGVHKCQYLAWILHRDGHADAERLPIRKMRRYDIRHMSDISDICRIYPTYVGYIRHIRIDAHRQKYPHGHP